jgi:acetyl/propionyl-CoA carboxylase alpha subunit
MRKGSQDTQLSLDGEHPVLLFIQDFGWMILAAIAALAGLLVLVYRLSFASSAQSENDFGNATTAFQRFQETYLTDEAASKAALTQLNDLMLRHPDLHGKYDAVIAQTLLYGSEKQTAQPYMQRTFLRVQKDNTPVYSNFAYLTSLIENGDYEQALVESKGLQERLEQKLAEPENQQKEFGNTLIAFNLLRIATLARQLGIPKEESQAWQDLWSYLTKPESQDIRNRFSSIASGEISLFDYIEMRKSKA